MSAVGFLIVEWLAFLISLVFFQTEVAVLYIDYGNRASVPKTKLGSLPAAFTGTGGFAKLYSLALVSLPQVMF